MKTDAYQSYNNLAGSKRTNCWSHVRRYFVDAVPKGKALDYTLPNVQGVLFYDKLFWHELYAREHNMTAEERYNYRLEKYPSVPILIMA